MENKQQAQKAVIKMKKYLRDVPNADLSMGTAVNSPYSKVYWLYQDVVNFMDQRNQHQTESWIDQAKDMVEHPIPDLGYDTIRYRDKLEMAIIQMGHGLGIDWGKEKIY